MELLLFFFSVLLSVTLLYYILAIILVYHLIVFGRNEEHTQGISKKKKEEILSDDILCILYLYRTCIRVGGVYYVWARTPFTNVKRRQSKERRKKNCIIYSRNGHFNFRPGH